MKLPRPKFSLRTLVIFPLLCTCGFGLWWRWEPWATSENRLQPRRSRRNSKGFTDKAAGDGSARGDYNPSARGGNNGTR